MKALGQQTFIIRTDSKVIQEHVEKESEARNPVLMRYLEKVREMERHFKGYSVQHIPRDDNNEADKLAKAAARNQELPPDVFFRNHQRTIYQGIKAENRECSGDSRLESRNHGLSERPL
jgi:ribonuclease HI